MNVARLNMSHSDHKNAKKIIDRIKKLNETIETNSANWFAAIHDFLWQNFWLINVISFLSSIRPVAEFFTNWIQIFRQTYNK